METDFEKLDITTTTTTPHSPLPTPSSSTISPKLTPVGFLSGGASYDDFGRSVSLSDKGDVLVVGSPWHDEGKLARVGLIQAFRRSNPNHHLWKEIFHITGEDKGDKVGWYSLSLSGDGMRMIFGAYRASNRRGYAKLVEIESKKVMKLVGDNEDYWFGGSVSISIKGNRVAVAARSYITVLDIMEDGSLRQVGGDIPADEPSVALSASGNVLGIGEDYYGNRKGRVRVMEWDGRRWSPVGEAIIGDDNNDGIGWSLDISADGHRVLIGTGEGGNYVEAYQYNGTRWEMMGQKLEVVSDNDDEFGNSVSLSNDGNRLVVGSPEFTSDGLKQRGRALVFQYRDGSWTQIGNGILGEKARDYAGWSVSISGDGNYVALGNPYADSEEKDNVGSVTVYKIE